MLTEAPGARQHIDLGRKSTMDKQYRIITLLVFVCVCVKLNTKILIHLAKWGHFFQSEDIMRGPNNFKGLFEG